MSLKRRTVRFGALAPPIREQFPELPKERARIFQKDVDAISTLRVKGLISWREGERAYERLFKAIMSDLNARRALSPAPLATPKASTEGSNG